MRLRCLLVFCVFLMLFSLSACSEKTKELKLTEFESEVTITNAENKISGTFNFSSPSKMNFTVDFPEEMRGITLSFDGETLTVTSDDLTLPLENISFGEDMFSPLFDAVSMLCFSQLQIKETGMNTLSIPNETGEHIIEFSSDEMKIISVQSMENTYGFQYH